VRNSSTAGSCQQEVMPPAV